MPEQFICDGCGLEFDEKEINVDGLCRDCAADYADTGEDEDDDDDI